MNELMGDEMLLSFWPDQYLNKPSGLDLLVNNNQQLIPVPVVLLDDGRFAFKTADGQICLVDRVQDLGEDGQNLPQTLVDPTTEFPPFSDATIKSLLVQENLSLDPDMGLANPETLEPEMQLEEHLSEVVPAEIAEAADSAVLPVESIGSPIAVDDDLNPLVSFRCQFCSFSSTDVPSLMEHSRTHEQPEQMCEETIDPENLDPPLTQDSIPVDTLPCKVHFVCSECKEPRTFTTIEACRDHMIIDHKMVFDVDIMTGTELSDKVMDDMTNEEVKIIEGEEDREPKIEETETPTKALSPPPFKDHLVPKQSKPRKKPKDYDPEFEAKPHKCPESSCTRRFSTLNFLQIHKSCHPPNVGRSFSCCKCTMLFFKWDKCVSHLWREHRIDCDMHSCNVCGEYKTTTRRKLECHMKIHRDERPYKCKHCDKGFKQPTQLINHVSSVHKEHNQDTGQKWYMAQKCEICLKIYADSKCLKKHMQAVHSKLKPYKCQICGHMSARKAMMQVHMRQHTGEKPFTCSYCPFKTGDHNSLRRHIMRHTGDKPYNCPHCSYSSIQASTYKLHLQNRHPGLSGSFTCKLCHFVTISEESYKKHLSDHKLNLIPAGDNEVFPENMAAASLVYHSFGATRCNITARTTSEDGMEQTITIAIPNDNAASDDDDTTHFLPDTGGITIPAEPDDQSLINY